jgi:hypothetical protein
MKVENGQTFNRLESAGLLIGGAGFYTGILSAGYEIATQHAERITEAQIMTPLTEAGVAGIILGAALMWTGFAKETIARRRQASRLPTSGA